MNIICPSCHCTTVVKNGKRRGLQRFKCQNANCRLSWTQNDSIREKQKQKQNDMLWQEYVDGGTIEDLINTSALALSDKTIRRRLHDYPEPVYQYQGSSFSVVIIDAVYFNGIGELVAMDNTSGECIALDLNSKEKVSDYKLMLTTIKSLGCRPQAVVIDGRNGVRQMFEREGLMVQKCQRHQQQTIEHYLGRFTQNPIKKSLLGIADKMFYLSPETISDMLTDWYDINQEYVEQTIISAQNNKLVYLHQSLHSAYRSLIVNLPYLYTHTRTNKLIIPNTTSKLEGKFGLIMPKLNSHRGLSKSLKRKMFKSLLFTTNSR